MRWPVRPQRNPPPRSKMPFAATAAPTSCRTARVCRAAAPKPCSACSATSPSSPPVARPRSTLSHQGPPHRRRLPRQPLHPRLQRLRHRRRLHRKPLRRRRAPPRRPQLHRKAVSRHRPRRVRLRHRLRHARQRLRHPRRPRPTLAQRHPPPPTLRPRQRPPRPCRNCRRGSGSRSCAPVTATCARYAARFRPAMAASSIAWPGTSQRSRRLVRRRLLTRASDNVRHWAALCRPCRPAASSRNARSAP